MTNHSRTPQKKKSSPKSDRGFYALEKELEQSFETIFRNSFDVQDIDLIHAVGKVATVRNLFARAIEDDVRYIPIIKVEIIKR